MPVDTTLYIHETTMGLIDDACVMKGIKRNAMIVLLLKHAMADRNLSIRTGCRVHYQRRDTRERWHTVHVRFREDEADYVKDLRNFLKLSDSLILAMAARTYLNDIVRKSKSCDRIDNYRFSSYVLSSEVVDGLIQWKIYWGYKNKPELMADRIPKNRL